MKVYIWGNGKVAKKFVEKATFKKEVEMAGYVVSDERCSVDAVCYSKVEFNDDSIVIIASSFTDEILKTIIFHTKLKMSQCIALRPTEFSEKFGVNIKNIWKVIENPFPFVIDNMRKVTVLRTGLDYKRDCLWDAIPRPDEVTWLYDYVRINTFDLVAREIESKCIDGAVAELGVYRGDFSQYINMRFPNRKCYLFDTFTGFDEKEANEEINLNYTDREFADSFKDTSEQLVLNKMPFPNQCIIKKGLFPESLDGLEEKFVFVSIDVDFGNSILEGLRYFYPRLQNEGYIFVHDYNNSSLEEVKKAIEKYEQEFGKLKKVPIADEAGTLIIVK